ncbi:DNA methyltransferase [Paracoccus denitrificans]|uniref:DNA methyltransferase n=1 Tax=Paracoccus denitrificans TaxID=266 RepID=UPI0039BF83E2
MRDSIKRQLKNIDWDFSHGDDRVAAGIHWYPGTFIPSIPVALIEALSSPGETVFDPYCGSGTTGISSLMRGRNIVLTDLNPIAVMSSTAALSLASLRLHYPNLFSLCFDIIESVLDKHAGKSSLVTLGDRHVQSIDDAVLGLYAGDLQRDTAIQFSAEPNRSELEPWYDPSTLQDIVGLNRHIGKCLGSGPTSFIAHTMLSACLRQLCSQTQSWGHIADNVHPKQLTPKPAIRALKDWLRRARNRFSKISQLERGIPIGTFRVVSIQWGSGHRITPIPFDLLVTSPPYAGAIDYTLSQRLSLFLLGWSTADMSALVRSEIGARRKRGKTTHIPTWAREVAETAALHCTWANSGAHAAYVFPHKDSGRALGEDEIVSHLAEQGWALEVQSNRSIRQARTRQAWTSIKKETILIFGR